jgi:hypothetical protein
MPSKLKASPRYRALYSCVHGSDKLPAQSTGRTRRCSPIVATVATVDSLLVVAIHLLSMRGNRPVPIADDGAVHLPNNRTAPDQARRDSLGTPADVGRAFSFFGQYLHGVERMTKKSELPLTYAPSAKLRTPEAARHVGLAPATLCKLRCVGGGPRFTRLGRAIVYDLVDLEGWVASHGKRVSTAADPDVRP